MKAALVFAFAVGCSSASLAADATFPEIITNQGIAFSVEDEKTKQVTAYDTVAAFDDHTITVADCAKHRVAFRNVSWCFATAAHQQSFINEMANKKGSKYIPFGGGRCSQGLSNGRLDAEGDPRTAIVVQFSGRPQDKMLFLNGGFSVRASFFGNPLGISQARETWRTAHWLGKIVPNKPGE